MAGPVPAALDEDGEVAAEGLLAVGFGDEAEAGAEVEELYMWILPEE